MNINSCYIAKYDKAGKYDPSKAEGLKHIHIFYSAIGSRKYNAEVITTEI